MASIGTTSVDRGTSAAWLAALFTVVVLLGAIGRAAGLSDIPQVETFVLVFASIVIEALPFILLGAAVSALIEVYVSDALFARVVRLPVALQLPGAALGGFAFPVCECGSVPVARRLIARGLHPSAGVAFMLASPILNPVVLASTWVAYGGRGLGLQMVAARGALGLTVALIAGWAVAGEGVQVKRGQSSSAVRTASKGQSFVEHLSGDFFFMGRFLVAGAALAAALQTMVPQSLVAGVARTPVLGSLALMGVAFLLSLCSEADAFVAVSLTPFPLGSQLAFLVFGPVMDAKLTFLYGATFGRRFVMRVIVVAIPVVLAGSLWFEVLLR
ncbi:MAG: permease [Actinomycetota bacterium]|nr:permease [Actinomycetota bacterium]